MSEFAIGEKVDNAADDHKLRRPKIGIVGGNCGRTSGSIPAAGNGIFGCRDRAPKIAAKCANANRDQNPGTEWPEIPAETRYSASRRKRAVCGDWMVGALGLEPGTR